MSKNKNVIVVAPDKYKKSARNLAHEISKMENVDSVYWSVKAYQDNEFQQSGRQYVIFIGNPDENEFTAHYLDVIKPEKKTGYYHGYDENKAIAYGEGKFYDSEDFQDSEEFKDCWVILLPVFGIPFLIDKKKQKLLKKQTEAAIRCFLSKDINNWLGINFKDKASLNTVSLND